MGKIAFLFAGQGSQHVGMGDKLFAGKSGGIYDVMRDGPAEELNKTVNAQYAIFLQSLAEARALQDKGIKADCAAGFSLGEVTALAFAGVIDGDEFVKVRATAMQECCEKNRGVMVAVMRLSSEKVVELCGQFDNVWAVNFNSSDQTVCSCDASAADDFVKAVAAAGGRTIVLKTSGAFHCPHMDDASMAVAQYLCGAELGIPSVPVYCNLTAMPFFSSAELIYKQINSPVLWQKTIENMISSGVDTFIECGPGAVLSGLVKKIAGESVKIQKAEDLI